MRTLILAGVIIAALWIGFSLLTFSVDETQRAVVLKFGEIQRTITEPGLNFKTPFLENVIFLEDRLLSLDIQPATSLTLEKQQLTIDSYTLWRINDPQLYVQSIEGALRIDAETKLDNIVYSIIRDNLGEVTFEEALQRSFLENVKQQSSQQAADLGIEIVDVRIKRADLPESNEQAVYDRMISERRQIAEGIRAEGEQQALDIRSDANAQVEIIKAEGLKQAEELRGEGDAQALEIYANAYNQDPGFFLFWRTLESYKLTLASNTTLVLSADSEYLKLLDTMTAQSLLESINR